MKTINLEISDRKKFATTVQTIERDEDFILVTTRTGKTEVISIPEEISRAEKYGISITVQELKERKPRQPKKPKKEPKKRNFTENQLRHQQEFGAKIKEFWKK